MVIIIIIFRTLRTSQTLCFSSTGSVCISPVRILRLQGGLMTCCDSRVTFILIQCQVFCTVSCCQGTINMAIFEQILNNKNWIGQEYLAQWLRCNFWYPHILSLSAWLGQLLCFGPNFLLVHIPRGKRSWLKDFGPCHLGGIPAWSPEILALTWPTSDCFRPVWEVNQ